MLDAFVRIPSGEPVICPAALALATDERGKKRLGESRYVPRLSESLANLLNLHGLSLLFNMLQLMQLPFTAAGAFLARLLPIFFRLQI